MRGVRADQGGGRAAHAVLQGLSAAVLLSHHRCDGADRVAGQHRDGHAWGQHQDDGGSDCPHRDGGGAALCDPRGRAHCRGRRRVQDPEVMITGQ